jgi:uncharacterized protein YlxP (DUF503 family)
MGKPPVYAETALPEPRNVQGHIRIPYVVGKKFRPVLFPDEGGKPGELSLVRGNKGRRVRRSRVRYAGSGCFPARQFSFLGGKGDNAEGAEKHDTQAPENPGREAEAKTAVPVLPASQNDHSSCIVYLSVEKMIVSMIQLIFEIPDVLSIKDKRRIVNSLKEKLQRRFHMSAAEIDLQDSLSFAHVGAAVVSNSRQFGESVLHKALAMIENDVPVRIQNVQIHSEEF